MKKLFPFLTSGPINSILVLCFFCFYANAQDTTKSVRVLYKIPVTKANKTECAAKPVIVADKNNTIISCVVNSVSKEAVISIIDSNGNVSKEKVVIKEINK